MPLLMALCVVIGILIGTFYANHFSGNRLNIINSGSSRLSNLLHIIDDQYVDSVNIDELVDKAIPEILSELDPHSVYISAKDVQLATDDLKGSFSGVGIEFNIRQDTLRIQNVIKDGPADKAGLLAGDKVVSINGKAFVGKDVTNEEAMHRLKGPKDSKVKIGVKRYGEKGVKMFTVTRGDIAVKSVSAAYMLNDTTGYIRIKNFGERTYAEMLAALQTLNIRGADHLVIDLRDNGGGILESAVQMSNEFLPKNRLIVYTQGRKSPRVNYRSDGKGSYQHIPMVVLINEGSASAAEIFAGAMQDNDRATIVGRRSFGKGLVQQQIQFNDGSLIRLTIARYTPDIFVPEDTSKVTSYYKEAVMSGLILQYAFNYTDSNRKKLSSLGELKPLANYLEHQNLVGDFVNFAEKNGLRRRNLMIMRSHSLLQEYLNSRIIYNILDEQAWIEYVNRDDDAVKEAVKVFQTPSLLLLKPKQKSQKQSDSLHKTTTQRR